MLIKINLKFFSRYFLNNYYKVITSNESKRLFDIKFSLLYKFPSRIPFKHKQFIKDLNCSVLLIRRHSRVKGSFSKFMHLKLK